MSLVRGWENGFIIVIDNKVYGGGKLFRPMACSDLGH